MTKKEFNEKVMSFISPDLSNIHDAFIKNEIQANRVTGLSLFAMSIIILTLIVLGLTGVYNFSGGGYTALSVCLIDFIVGMLTIFVTRGKGKVTKYIIIFAMAGGMSASYSFIGYPVALFVVVPLLLSGRYYQKGFVIYAISIVLFLMTSCGMLGGAFGNYNRYLAGLIENVDTMTKGQLLAQSLLHVLLPTIFGIIVVGIVALNTAIHGKSLAQEEMDIKLKASQTENELKLATDIQANMLPRIFPPFPDHKEFDIYAIMNPAKEVGGDFYDFFMTDDTHVAIVIADVSGKGVPAALFMVTAKTLIKDHTQLSLTPSEVFTRVNKMLCEGNDAGLFVTAWLGLLDLENGILQYVNAGHNPPLLKSTSNEYKYLRGKRGLVLAGMDAIKYKMEEIKLTPGDRIFLYTDGVTEATNEEDKLYGDDRLLSYMNAHIDEPIDKVLNGLRQDIKYFTGKRAQFDDITMLILDYQNQANSNLIEKIFDARVSEMNEVNMFIETELEKLEVPMKIMNEINICIEEMFTNVCKYGYTNRLGKAKITLLPDGDYLTIVLKDTGIPFNPLSKVDPDIKAKASERKIGGLGIFMVKKMMDEVSYEYIDSMNVFTMKKKIREQ